MFKAESRWENYYQTLKRLPKRMKKHAQFVVNAIPIFKQHNIQKILDLGCGAGRHCIYLADKGFDVVGVDISKSALTMARKWGQKEGLTNVALIRAAMTYLPFRDCCFDAVVSVSVIHHAVIKDIEITVGEIYRILNGSGLFLANLASVKDPRYGTGQKVEENTFRVLEAFEERHFEELHHFCTKDEVVKLLSIFTKTDVALMKHKPNYWEIMTTK